MDSVDVAAEKPDRMSSFRSDVLESKKVVWHLWWTRHLRRSLQTKNQKIQN